MEAGDHDLRAALLAQQREEDRQRQEGEARNRAAKEMAAAKATPASVTPIRHRKT